MAKRGRRITLEYSTFHKMAKYYLPAHHLMVRDELLNREIFTTLREAKILIEQWRKEYNHVRPHSAKNNRPPAPEAILVVTTT